MQAVGHDPNFPPQHRHVKSSIDTSGPTGLLTSIATFLQRLADRLDPQRLYLKTAFTNVAAGVSIAVLEPKQQFNGIIASIPQGTVNVYFGAGANPADLNSLKPDLIFGASTSPIYLPFPARDDLQVAIWVDQNSTTAAIGTIVLVNY